jgi:hypothetical protein
MCKAINVILQQLADNKDNSEPVKMATQLAHSLKQKGWDIRTAWTPSHKELWVTKRQTRWLS